MYCQLPLPSNVDNDFSNIQWQVYRRNAAIQRQEILHWDCGVTGSMYRGQSDDTDSERLERWEKSGKATETFERKSDPVSLYLFGGRESYSRKHCLDKRKDFLCAINGVVGEDVVQHVLRHD